MLQRNALSSVVPPVSFDLPSALGSTMRERVRNNPLGLVVRILSMPLDRGAFLGWMTIVILFGIGAGAHVGLSVQIAQARIEAASLRAEHTQIEVTNAELLWQISRYTNLPAIRERAVSMGFRMDFSNQYMVGAGDLPTGMTALPSTLPALPPFEPGQTAAPNLGPVTDSGTASRMDFGRLGISVQRADWFGDLRMHSQQILADLDLGLDRFWADLRVYGERAWQGIAGPRQNVETTFATTR